MVVVVSLPSIHKALSSIPSPTKLKWNKKLIDILPSDTWDWPLRSWEPSLIKGNRTKSSSDFHKRTPWTKRGAQLNHTPGVCNHNPDVIFHLAHSHSLYQPLAEQIYPSFLFYLIKILTHHALITIPILPNSLPRDSLIPFLLRKHGARFWGSRGSLAHPHHSSTSF